MPWSATQRANAVALYFTLGSWALALRALRREWGRQQVPGRRTLMRWVQGFHESGSVDTSQTHHRSPRTPQTVRNHVRRLIKRNPRLSLRRLSAKTGASPATCQRILRNQLRLFPYKLQMRQRLYRGDRAKRTQFCRWLLSKWGSPHL